MSATLTTELTNHFRGLKRKSVQSVASGESNIKVGKEPLSFGLFRFLCKKLLKQGKKDFQFGHCFHISLLTEMRKIQAEIYQILPAVNNSVENTIAGIIQELEKRAIGAGTVTRDGLEGLLRLTLEQEE